MRGSHRPTYKVNANPGNRTPTHRCNPDANLSPQPICGTSQLQVQECSCGLILLLGITVLHDFLHAPDHAPVKKACPANVGRCLGPLSMPKKRPQRAVLTQRASWQGVAPLSPAGGWLFPVGKR